MTRAMLLLIAGSVTLYACIELPDELPEARFGSDAGGGGATGGGGIGGDEAQTPDASPVDMPDAAPAPEVCNGVDDDLDDSIDEGVRNACGACGALPDEVCDSYDNDCDHIIDEAEECACQPGLEEPCGVARGICTVGVRTCSPDGQWGPCSGIGPESEVCNDIDDNCDGDTDEGVQNACGGCGSLPREVCNGADDDCDGITDGRAAEGDLCACPPGADEPCGTDVGACSFGRRVCRYDGWGPCDGAVEASPEQCNRVDDDCDGEIDEDACDCQHGTTRACGSNVGYCRAGTERCSDGSWGPCAEERRPRDEQCNQVDDDCDGAADEGACDCQNGETRPCGSDVGRCQPGTQTCVSGGWGMCQGEVGPDDERCNGVDDDCDGAVDEPWPALGNPCADGVGACRAQGEIVCLGGQPACDATAGAARNEVCNGVDDDCDGGTDEDLGDFECDTGLPGPCGSGAASCIGGDERCDPLVVARAEVCNGTDDDCDGRTDEGTGGGPCDTGQSGRCGPGTLACVGALEVCQRNQAPANESCNGVDDDCDGAVDEPPLLQEPECIVRGNGICARGVPICVGGETECQTPDPRNESCNGLDDDCDGRTDENLGGQECATGEQGVCAAGISSCANGQMFCVRETAPRAEGEPDRSTCNARDDDCDGAIDEDHPRRRACDVGTADYHCSNGRITLCPVGPEPEPGPDPEPVPQ